MKIKRFFDDIKMPTRSYEQDVGLDICLPCGLKIKSLETKVVGLGLSVEIPEGFAGLLVPRSSTATKGLIVQTSIIDPGYTGEIHLIVTNCSSECQELYKNQRVCSLVLFNVHYTRIDVDNLSRQNNGLGSSGT